MKHETKFKKAGFTLIELLVSLAVFSLAIIIVINLFSSMLRMQRKSFVVQNVQENGRYLMSFIAKELRMSDITTSDGTNLSSLSIIHPTEGSITYSFSGNQILRNGQPLNSDEVLVTGRFIVDGKSEIFPQPPEQPRVTIVMKAQITGTKPEEGTAINLQVTLTQRNLDQVW